MVVLVANIACVEEAHMCCVVPDLVHIEGCMQAEGVRVSNRAMGI